MLVARPVCTKKIIFEHVSTDIDEETRKTRKANIILKIRKFTKFSNIEIESNRIIFENGKDINLLDISQHLLEKFTKNIIKEIVNMGDYLMIIKY